MNSLARGIFRRRRIGIAQRGESFRLMRCRGRDALGRDRLRRWLGARLRCCAVPAAGGGGDIDGVVWLRLGAEGLDRELGGGERLRVEALCDVIALARRIRVALGGGEAE